jgi:23S rRNA (adenine2503-C2)-methyltransferase
MNKPLIYDLDIPDLKEILQSWGEPNYRVKQIWQGIYQSLWHKPEDFINIPKTLREKLFTHFSFNHLHPITTSNSTDGETQKVLFELPDGRLIETVRMKYEKRRTLCISTQSGCAMGCTFCATGQMGFGRNLSSGEIIEQVLFYARKLRELGERVTNIVLMGMGEPFHNYENVMTAISRLNDSDGMKLGSRRFTISTVGLVPAIRRFTKENSQVNLAVSLHAADDSLRESMLPVNKRFLINELMAALKEYSETTRRRITFEWALISGVNDTPEQAHKLAALLKGLLTHVNVIPLNPTDGFEGHATNSKQAKQFQSILENQGISCTIRVRRGIDIQAGCGQLASRNTPNQVTE